MLAELGDKPFDNSEWVFETKLDGYRALALCDGQGDVQLYSRNLLSFNAAYAPIAEELKKIKFPCLLDGEIVVEDAAGRSHFQLLQGYRKTGEGPLKYYVFDLLSLDNTDTTTLTLLQRKDLLEVLLKKHKLKNIFYSEHIATKGIALYEAAVKKGLEGLIAKKADSEYVPDSRSWEWLKIKITNEQEAVICGITAPKGGRKFFGSLLLGVYEDGHLVYTGNCGTGFDFDTLKELYQKFEPLFTNTSPFEERVGVRGEIQWMKPKLVCQVKFTEWTGDGSMRHPVYLGLRKDKSPKEVRREIPGNMKKTKATKATTKKGVVEEAEEPSAKDFEKKVGKVTLKLTNQQKIYWPDEKITKGELVDYYDKISPFILPYLKDRPQSLNRFPNGIKGPSFYQKDMDVEKLPSWLRTEKIYSESNKEDIDYLICNDKATLLYMANLGCIEINPWNSRLKNLDKPDWLVIDLDPEDISFAEVIKAAHATKKVCDSLEIDCHCKTSGATGLHIYIPLAAKYEYEIVRSFAQLIAQKVHQLLPNTTSLERQPKKRQKKVYPDYLQNSKGQTLAAPYSVRPKPGATVSTPLEWSEVNSKLDPRNFTIKNIFKRLDKKGDLWKAVLGKGADLRKAMERV